MSTPKDFKPSRLELEVLHALWSIGTGSIREIQEAFPERERPEYTTVQTIVYRLEEKGAVRRAKKIGNAHIFEPLVTQQSTLGTLIDDFIDVLGGSPAPLLSHLLESKKLSAAELNQMEEIIKQHRKK